MALLLWEPSVPVRCVTNGVTAVLREPSWRILDCCRVLAEVWLPRTGEGASLSSLGLFISQLLNTPLAIALQGSLASAPV